MQTKSFRNEFSAVSGKKLTRNFTYYVRSDIHDKGIIEILIELLLIFLQLRNDISVH